LETVLPKLNERASRTSTAAEHPTTGDDHLDRRFTGSRQKLQCTLCSLAGDLCEHSPAIEAMHFPDQIDALRYCHAVLLWIPARTCWANATHKRFAHILGVEETGMRVRRPGFVTKTADVAGAAM
jgi:hypothetical protein